MRLLPAAIVVSASLVALSACSSSPAPVASTSPSSQQTEAPTIIDEGLSFDQGKNLGTDLETAPVFLNSFGALDSGWSELDETDAAQGYWVYESDDAGCTAKLSQLAEADNTFDLVDGDDAASSVNALAWYFRDSEMVDQVSAGAVDATIPYGEEWAMGDPSVAFKGVSAQTDDGEAFATFARVFTVPRTALIIDVTCISTDAFAAHIQDALLNSAVRES